MSKRATRALLIVAVLAITARAGAQTLGEAAAREKERRAKQSSDKPAKVYGDEELAKAKGSSYTQLDGPTPTASATPSPGATASSPAVAAAVAGPASGTGSVAASSASGFSTRDESSWRSRAKAARARVTSLEAEVKELDAKATGSAFGSGVTETCYQPQRVSSKEQEQAVQDCMKRRQNQPLRENAERGQVMDRLARAREALAQAKRAVTDLEEEARKAGVPAGWVRE